MTKRNAAAVLAFAHALAVSACLSACAQKAPEAARPAPAPIVIAPVKTAAPAGAYVVDKSHTSVIFRVDHMGFSHFTGRFTRVDVSLTLDPANPAAATLVARIDPNSIDSDNAPKGFMDELRAAPWFETAKFPDMTFKSTHVELTAPNAATITGDLTMHGQTHPVTLAATFNGGYAGHPMDPHARVGFSAHGALRRSDFGISVGVPQPPSTFGVGDNVEIIIETELSGPAWTPAPAAPAAPAP